MLRMSVWLCGTCGMSNCVKSNVSDGHKELSMEYLRILHTCRSGTKDGAEGECSLEVAGEALALKRLQTD